MKTVRGTIHQLAQCIECDIEWQDYQGHHARKKAYDHAKKTGHNVRVETATSITYNPK